MAQIFHPSANTLARASIIGVAFVAITVVMVTHLVIKSPYQTDVNVVKSQPVPFSHDHHVAGLGIECRYCHTSVEESAFAGIPPTYTCMSCHSKIWVDSPMLAPVRESLALDRPIEWNKIHDLPDYTYFNHAIHVNKGVGCASCHGRVDEMPLMWKDQTMSMGWCLECHRNPEQHLRPKGEIYNMAWSVGSEQEAVKEFVQREAEPETYEFLASDDYISQEELGLLLAEMYEVPTLGHNTPLTNCAVCHR